MEKEKNKNIIIVILCIVILILLVVLILGLTGVINFKGKENIPENTVNSPEINIDKSNDNNDFNKETLTDLENDDINKFLNVYENSLMAYLEFDSPDKVLNKNNFDWLTQLMISTEYAKKLTSDGLPKTSFTLSDIKNALKSLTNYDYSDDEIKSFFSELYDSEKNAYVYEGGGGFLTFKLVDGYETDNNYYITINNEEIGEDTIKVVLQKNNNKYYYYSSTGYK